MPKNFDAEIQKGTWPILPIFSLIQKVGKVEDKEMHRVFNMGIGLVVIVPEEQKNKVEKILKNKKYYLVGKIIKGSGKTILK